VSSSQHILGSSAIFPAFHLEYVFIHQKLEVECGVSERRARAVRSARA